MSFGRVSHINNPLLGILINLPIKNESSSLSNLVFNIKNHSINYFKDDIIVSGYNNVSRCLNMCLTNKGRRYIDVSNGAKMPSLSSMITRGETRYSHGMRSITREEMKVEYKEREGGFVASEEVE